MDYLYCRTDEPRGKLYDYQPERLKGKNIQNQELREFIEMCFDPQAPVNKCLKEALFRIMEEGQEKTWKLWFMPAIPATTSGKKA